MTHAVADEPRSRGSLRSQAAAGGRWTAAAGLIGAVLQLVQLAVLGRLLEPSDFGLMAMMMVVVGLAISVADFGVGNYIVQSSQLSRSLFRRLLTLAIALSFSLMAVIAFAASNVAGYYHAPELVGVLPWLGISIIAGTVGQILLCVLQRELAFKTIAIGDIASVALSILVSIALAWAGYGLWSLVAGQVVLAIARVALYSRPAEKILRGLPRIGSVGLSDALRFGSYQAGERLSNFLSSNVDKLIVGRFHGDRGLGIYSVAYQLAMRPFLMLNPIFTRVALPIFAKLKNDDQRLSRGYLEVVRTIALISFPIYIALAVAAPAIVRILLGEQWGEAAPVLAILCGLGALFAISNPIGSLLLAKGRADLAFHMNIIALATYVSAFYLGKSFGITGVAWAFLLCALFILYPLEFYFRRKLVGMTVGQYFWAMRNHLIGGAVPITCFVGFSLLGLVPQGLGLQLLAGVLCAGFFGGYLWLTERELVDSTYRLVVSR